MAALVAALMGAPSNASKGRLSVQVSLPRPLVERLVAEAEAREVGRSFIVRKALEEWLAGHGLSGPETEVSA